MIKLERYTGEKTYMFPNGHLAAPDAVRESFPAVDVFTHVVETDQQGEVLFALENLNALRSMHGIDPELDEDGAIAALEEMRNTPAPVVVRPETRIADALETLAADSQIEQVFATLEGRN